MASIRAAGHEVSLAQLERWRREKLLVSNERVRLGRGKGTGSRLPPGAIDQAIALASVSRQGAHPLWLDPVYRAAANLPYRHGSVKRRMLVLHGKLMRRLEADLPLIMDPDVAGDRRQAAAARLTRRGGSWCDPAFMITYALDPDADTYDPGSAVTKEVAQTMSQLLAGGFADITKSDVRRALAAFNYDPIPRPGDVRAELESDVALEFDSDLRPLRSVHSCLAETAEVDLVEALSALFLLGTALSLIQGIGGLVAVAGPQEYLGDELSHLNGEVVRAATLDPMWATWGRTALTLYMPFLMNKMPETLTYAATCAVYLGRVPAITAYAQRMIALAIPSHDRSHLQTPPVAWLPGYLEACPT